jgi:hypothetical protein
MSLKPVSIRFDPNAWEFIAREAAARGIPAAEYVRVAALTRATVDFARRDPQAAEQSVKLNDAVQKFFETRPFSAAD